MSELPRLGPPGLLAGAFVSVPGRVVLPAAIASDLPRDRRWCAPECTGDGTQGIATPDPEQDLLTLAHVETAWARLPAERLAVAVPARAHHQAHHRCGAPDLPGDIDQALASCTQPQCQLLLLR